MPTYEYRCDACGHEFEKFQSMKTAPIRTCPSCHKRKVKRLLGMGGALIFKGSGFYATDYRSSGYKESAKKDVAPAAPAKDAAPAAPAKGCEGCKQDAKSCPKNKAK
jgi:putative FmdB family regulatory protein